jgi:hypothetical protein
MQDLGSGWGDTSCHTTGEPKRMKVTETVELSILSKEIAVSVVQGVEQVCAGGWEGVVGERAGHMHRK